MSDRPVAAPPENTSAEPSTAAAPRRTRFSARDLLNVALFAVLYFVIVFAIAMLGIVSPLVMLLTLPLSVIAAGIPYMLFLTRVRHAGMAALFGLVIGLLFLVTGHPWISTLVTVAAALAAEAALRLGRYRSRWAAIWAHALFSLWFIGPMVPLLLDRAAYLDSPGMRAMGPEYVEAFDRTVSVTVLWAYSGSTLVCGLLGGLLGAFLLKKHFTKAGLA
ncbi:MptD family putative ECF transporter S component [Glycomyces terrestris]|uniref:Trep_Strep domain-containing protein n=1 Tax=Glycomyces terrestris TaxID=2493553 RepID=A0A426V3D1_9ACTN|nr:MptD family putative ECF transporter S component [Glycomyces terrestris]RRS01403.1 Trep_Strep domain-containing protein [Glycomyces terrestris]